MTGIYLHVPFCAHHCDYCDFAVVTGAEQLMPRYVEALRTEIATTAERRWPTITSVFVGGGTPTLLPPDDLACVLRALRAAFPVAEGAEVTVETNPETITADSLAPLIAAGLTRVSIGAQSFNASVLATLGRRHDPERTLRAVADAGAAGIRHVNLDLIYGTPGETDQSWRDSLRTAVDTGVDHVSAYALTVEPNTVYARRMRANGALAPDEDVQAGRMAIAEEVLSTAGLARYEVSNWARPGAQSVHNQTYWRGGNWLAFGAAAHGHWNGRRWWNLRPTARYIDEVLGGRTPVAGEERLDPATRRLERLMTGLRTVEGVPRAAVDPVDNTQVTALTRAGLLHDDPTTLRPTPEGLPFADALTRRLLQ